MSNGVFGRQTSLPWTFSPSLYFTLPGEMLWEAEKDLVLCKYCSAVTKIPSCCQCCFQHKSKPQPILADMKKINFMTAKTSTITIKMSSGQRKREEESKRQKFMYPVFKKKLVSWQQYLPLTYMYTRKYIPQTIKILMWQQNRIYHIPITIRICQKWYLQLPGKFKAEGHYLVMREHSSSRWKKASEEFEYSFTPDTNDIAAEYG